MFILLLLFCSYTVGAAALAHRVTVLTEKEYFRTYQKGRAKYDEHPESKFTCRIDSDVFYVGTEYNDGVLKLANYDFLWELAKSPSPALVRACKGVHIIVSLFRVINPRCCPSPCKPLYRCCIVHYETQPSSTCIS